MESCLSAEDKEALRLGRELLKKKEEEPYLFDVNTEYHKHLKADTKEDIHKHKRKKRRIKKNFQKTIW